MDAYINNEIKCNVDPKGRAIMHKWIIAYSPVGIEQGKVTKIPIHVSSNADSIAYEPLQAIKDNDIAVLLQVLNSYTRGRKQALDIFKSKDSEQIKNTDFLTIVLDIPPLSKLIYKNSISRPQLILKSLHKISNMSVHITRNGKKTGFFKIIAGAGLFDHSTKIRISINMLFLYDTIHVISSYDHNKFSTLNIGLDQRLFLAIESRKKPIKKYRNGKIKWGYREINHSELEVAINSYNKNTIARVRESFQRIGVNFDYDKYKDTWYWMN